MLISGRVGKDALIQTTYPTLCLVLSRSLNSYLYLSHVTDYFLVASSKRIVFSHVKACESDLEYCSTFYAMVTMCQMAILGPFDVCKFMTIQQLGQLYLFCRHVKEPQVVKINPEAPTMA